jgi:hypothetical protein
VWCPETSETGGTVCPAGDVLAHLAISSKMPQLLRSLPSARRQSLRGIRFASFLENDLKVFSMFVSSSITCLRFCDLTAERNRAMSPSKLYLKQVPLLSLSLSLSGPLTVSQAKVVVFRIFTILWRFLRSQIVSESRFKWRASYTESCLFDSHNES